MPLFSHDDCLIGKFKEFFQRWEFFVFQISTYYLGKYLVVLHEDKVFFYLCKQKDGCFLSLLHTFIEFDKKVQEFLYK